jgi:hypothetical protein
MRYDPYRLLIWIPMTAACALAGQPAAAPDQPPRQLQVTAADSVPITPLSTSDVIVGFLRDVPGMHRVERRVIRDEKSWQAFWDTATVGNQYGNLPLRPAVSFDKEMLIIASTGLHRNYDEISVVRVERAADTLVVHVQRRINFHKGCMLDLLWAPVAIVRLPRDARPVRFVEQVIDQKCGYTE